MQPFLMPYYSKYSPRKISPPCNLIEPYNMGKQQNFHHSSTPTSNDPDPLPWDISIQNIKHGIN